MMKKASMFVVAAIAAFLPLRAVALDYNNPYPYYQSHQRGLEKMRRGECAKAFVIFQSEEAPNREEVIRLVGDAAAALECMGYYDGAIKLLEDSENLLERKTGKGSIEFEKKLIILHRKRMMREETDEEYYAREKQVERDLAKAEDLLRSEDTAREWGEAEARVEKRKAEQQQREIAKDDFDRSGTERLLRDLFLHNYFHLDASYRAPVTWDHLYSSKKIYTIGGQLLWFGVDYLSDTYKNKPVAGKEAAASPGWQFTFAPVTLGTWTGAETFTSKPKRDLEISFSPYLGYRLGGAWVGGGEIAVMSMGIRFSLIVERVSSGGGMPGGSRLGLGLGTGY